MYKCNLTFSQIYRDYIEEEEELPELDQKEDELLQAVDELEDKLMGVEMKLADVLGVATTDFKTKVENILTEMKSETQTQ